MINTMSSEDGKMTLREHFQSASMARYVDAGGEDGVGGSV